MLLKLLSPGNKDLAWKMSLWTCRVRVAKVWWKCSFLTLCQCKVLNEQLRIQACKLQMSHWCQRWFFDQMQHLWCAQQKQRQTKSYSAYFKVKKADWGGLKYESDCTIRKQVWEAGFQGRYTQGIIHFQCQAGCWHPESIALKTRNAQSKESKSGNEQPATWSWDCFKLL